MRTSESSEVPFRNYTPRWPSTEPAKTFKIISTRALTNFAKTLSQKLLLEKKDVALTGFSDFQKNWKPADNSSNCRFCAFSVLPFAATC